MITTAGEAPEGRTAADYDQTGGYGERQQARGSAESDRVREEADDVQSDRRPAADRAGMRIEEDPVEEGSGHGVHPRNG